MNFSLSNYSNNYAENEHRIISSNYESWDDRGFMQRETEEKRIFRPSESVEDIVNEWNKRLDQADNKVERNWITKNPNFERFKWNYWKEFYENYFKYKDTNSLKDNECRLAWLNDVIKNHPDLKAIEQELTMCLMQELLLNRYSELKAEAKNQQMVIKLMANDGVDYGNIV